MQAMSYLSDQLKAAREKAGFTQLDFAAELGEIVTNYNNIENGRRPLSKSKYPLAEKLLKLQTGTFKAWELVDLHPEEVLKLALKEKQRRKDI